MGFKSKLKKIGKSIAKPFKNPKKFFRKIGGEARDILRASKKTLAGAGAGALIAGPLGAALGAALTAEKSVHDYKKIKQARKDRGSGWTKLRKELGEKGLNWRNGSYDTSTMTRKDVEEGIKIFQKNIAEGYDLGYDKGSKSAYSTLLNKMDEFESEDRMMELYGAMQESMAESANAATRQADTIWQQANAREEEEKKVGESYKDALNYNYQQAQRRGLLSLTRFSDDGYGYNKNSYLGYSGE